MKIPSPEEFQEWQSHPVTKAFQDMVSVWRGALRDQMEQEISLIRESDTKDSKVLRLVEMGGNLSVLRELQDLDYGRFTSGLEE